MKSEASETSKPKDPKDYKDAKDVKEAKDALRIQLTRSSVLKPTPNTIHK